MMAEESGSSQELKSDFMACLLFEILKGTNGYLSDQARQFLPVLNKCMERNSDEFIVKGLNLLVDSEFKFFVKRRHLESAI